LRELGVLLVKHYGLHQGLWDVGLQMQVSIGNFGPIPDKALPGAMFNIAAIGLAKATVIGPLTLDAAEVNPIDPA
jgi:hypothetical protein